MDNLVAAYNTLNSSTGGPGLTGRQYNKLLRSICADFPVDVVHSIIQLLGKSATDIVEFPAFYSGVYACLRYEDFFEHAEWLFKGCDPEGTGSISREAFLSLIEQMAHSEYNTPPPSVFAEAIRSVGIDNPNKESVTFKEFVLALFNASSHEALAALNEDVKSTSGGKLSSAKTKGSPSPLTTSALLSSPSKSKSGPMSATTPSLNKRRGHQRSSSYSPGQGLGTLGSLPNRSSSHN
jgi:hypothetical protein